MVKSHWLDSLPAPWRGSHGRVPERPATADYDLKVRLFSTLAVGAVRGRGLLGCWFWVWLLVNRDRMRRIDATDATTVMRMTMPRQRPATSTDDNILASRTETSQVYTAMLVVVFITQTHSDVALFSIKNK
jgi:hypothetical protein